MMRLHITDHALVRFLSRAGGHPIEKLRASLVASLARAADAAASLGLTDYRIVADGLEYVVRDGKVVTIIDPQEFRQ